MPSTFDLVDKDAVYKGNTYTREVEVISNTAEQFDFTTAIMDAQIRREPGSPVLASFEITVDTVYPHKFVLNLPADVTGQLPVGERVARYDIRVEWPDGQVFSPLCGDVSVVPNITEEVG